MINRIVVKLERDKETNEMKFVFPEEDDRAQACFKLAQIALEDKENSEFKAGDGLGHLRNLFLGTTSSRRCKIWLEPDEKIRFCFVNPDYPKEEEIVVLKRKTESVTFVIEE